MKEKLCKIHSIDSGFCRINYIAESGGHKFHYCIQEDVGTFLCFRSSKDWEPDAEVIFRPNDWEIPIGDSELEIRIRDFIEEGLKNAES